MRQHLDNSIMVAHLTVLILVQLLSGWIYTAHANAIIPTVLRPRPTAVVFDAGIAYPLAGVACVSFAVGSLPGPAGAAGSNPLACFNLVALALRTHSSMGINPLADQGSLLGESKQHILYQGLQELFATKQHSKAYISAMATWVKAYIIRLPLAAAAATGESDSDQYDLEMMVTSLGHQLFHVCPQQIASSNSSIACNTAQLPADEQAPSPAPDSVRPSRSKLDLMEYVWLSRAVAALARHALDLPASNDDLGRSSGVCGSSRGTGVQGNDGSSSSDMSGADSSSSSGAAEPSTREEVVQTADMLGVSVKGTCSLRASVVGVAMCLHQQLTGWHAAATAEHGPAADKHTAAAASDEHVGPGAPTTTSYAASAAGGAEQLFGSYMLVLQTGLPAAVVERLELLRDRWPLAAPGIEESAEDPQVQLMVLQDVIGLCELLQREVPVPVGCNNPACLNLEGVAEMVTACKTCLGCHVACYCSRECQVGHWKKHKTICKQLQQ